MVVVVGAALVATEGMTGDALKGAAVIVASGSAPLPFGSVAEVVVSGVVAIVAVNSAAAFGAGWAVSDVDGIPATAVAIVAALAATITGSGAAGMGAALTTAFPVGVRSDSAASALAIGAGGGALPTGASARRLAKA